MFIEEEDNCDVSVIGDDDCGRGCVADVLAVNPVPDALLFEDGTVGNCGNAFSGAL